MLRTAGSISTISLESYRRRRETLARYTRSVANEQEEFASGRDTRGRARS